MVAVTGVMVASSGVLGQYQNTGRRADAFASRESYVLMTFTPGPIVDVRVTDFM